MRQMIIVYVFAKHALTQSMSRRGNSWNNAVAKGFFTTLKKQVVHGEHFFIRYQAK
jgi:putative transposase